MTEPTSHDAPPIDLQGDGGFAPPAAGFPGYAPLVATSTVAWEDTNQSLPARWWGTTKGVLFEPRACFEAASRNENPWPAIGYAMTTAGLAALVHGVIGFLPRVGLGYAGVGMVMALVHALVSPWVLAGVVHSSLRLLGGATRPFSSTVRVFAYCQAAQLFSLVPFLGPVFTAAFGFIASVNGLAATHRCSAGKVVVAMLFPAAILLVLMAALLVIGRAHH